MAVNTSWREDIRHTVFPNAKRGAPLRGRLYKRVVFASLKGAMGEKTVFPKAGGFTRVQAAAGPVGPGRLRFRPQGGLVQRGSYICRLLAAAAERL